jgi:hypothetical protein
MAAINKPQPANPENSGDKEARSILRTHVGSKGTKSTPNRTSPASAIGNSRHETGSQVTGQAKLTGGRG